MLDLVRLRRRDRVLRAWLVLDGVDLRGGRYVARNNVTDGVAFAAATTEYAKPLRRDAWPAGVAAWLLTPAVGGGGAMRRTPTAIGEAPLRSRTTSGSTMPDARPTTAIHATRLR